MILSVSRRTDIPAYYFEWFLNRINAGYIYVKNPFNPKQISKISITPEDTDCIVFWTKNPTPVLDKLDLLKDYIYYFQYTLNAYPESIESNLPALEIRIKAFQDLAKKIGKERVVWRYDPILLTDTIDVKYHLEHFEKVANALSDSTEHVVISIIDDYKKIRHRMQNINLRSFTTDELGMLFKGLKNIADHYNLKITSCAESIDLIKYGITPGKCIDDELISKLLNEPLIIKKDKNQREVCGCVTSIDIGAYNTCLNGCKYCYANYNDAHVKANVRLHNVHSPLLAGNVDAQTKITTRKIEVFKGKAIQISIFDSEVE